MVTWHTFEPQVLALFAALVALLGASAFVSGSETAFFSLSPANIHSIKKHHSRANATILKLLSMQDYLLATISIVNNFVNICIVILSNNIINRLVTFHNTTAEFIIKVIIVTFLLLLFGEILPKILGAYNALRFAQVAAPTLSVMKSVVKPFSYVLIKFGGLINSSVANRKANISIGELSNAIEITGNQSAEEKEMLSGIVSFVNTDVEQIMKARIDVVALDVATRYDAVKQVIIDSGFSRIPVYDESLDNIQGVLYVKDLLPYISEGDDFEWQKLMRKPTFVPENKKINDLLEEFQNTKVHMAIVVDEYGSTKGIVSLEDILEEIVGEISDESDIDEQQPYTRIDENTYIFDGKTHLTELEKVLKLGDDYFADLKGSAETIAGLMLEIKRDFLRKGETTKARNITLTVQSLEGRRIDKVKVTL